MPFTPFTPTIGGIAPPLPVADGGTGAATSAAASTALGFGSKVQDIGAAGTALQNGTPTFLTWNVPNDGNIHQFTVSSFLSVATAETGGAVLCNYTGPGGNATNFTVQPGAQAAGINATSNTRIAQPGTTVTVAQNTALTAGAATIWAQIWGV